MNLDFVIYILIWLVIAGVFGMIGVGIGRPKGRATEGFWFGFLLGFIGLLIVAILSPVPASTPHGVDDESISDFNALVRDRWKPGFMIDAQDGRTIIGVHQNSPAESAGIHEGDRLIAIDDVMCEGDYRRVIMQLVGERDSHVRVSVRRGAERLDFELSRSFM